MTATTGFSADWLRLREPFDHLARDSASTALELTEQVARWQAGSAHRPLEVVDLACGSGANLRELAPRLGGAQSWRLVDHDPALLTAAADALAQWAARLDYLFTTDESDGAFRIIRIEGPGFHAEVRRHRLDLAHDLSSLDFEATQLVTACALLDLVSASWLDALIRKARDARAALLFALSVDGRTTWDPADPLDESVHALFVQHQCRDKGFGLALGPQAPTTALQQLAEAGYRTRQARSDWVIEGERSVQMQLAMIDGMAAAALERAPARQGDVDLWKARRAARVGVSGLRVGHLDILATLDQPGVRMSRSHS